MKTLTISFFFILGIHVVSGQESFLKLSSGVARTSIDGIDSHSEFRIGHFQQVTYNSQISEHFYWGTGLGFYQKGNKFDIILTDSQGVKTDVIEIDWRFNYIGIPIYVAFQSGEKNSFFFEMGLIPAILASSKIIAPGENPTKEDNIWLRK